MISDSKNIEISNPKEQLEIYGYDDYFKYFVRLYKKNSLPNTILLSGQKGLGKAINLFSRTSYIEL